MKLYLHRIAHRNPAEGDSVSKNVGSDQNRRRIQGSHSSRARDAALSSKALKVQTSISSSKGKGSLSNNKSKRSISSGKNEMSISSKSKKSISSVQRKSKESAQNMHYKPTFLRLTGTMKSKSTTAQDNYAGKLKSNSIYSKKRIVRKQNAKSIDDKEDRNIVETIETDANDEPREAADLSGSFCYQVPIGNEVEAPAPLDWIFGGCLVDTSDSRKNNVKLPDQDVASNPDNFGVDSIKSGNGAAGIAATIFDKMGALFQGQNVHTVENRIAAEARDAEILSEERQSNNEHDESALDNTGDIIVKESIANDAAVKEIKVTIDVSGCGCLQSQNYTCHDDSETIVTKNIGKGRDNVSDQGSIDWDVESAQDTVFSYEGKSAQDTILTHGGKSDQGTMFNYEDEPFQCMVFSQADEYIQESAFSFGDVEVKDDAEYFDSASTVGSTDGRGKQTCKGISPAKNDCTVIEPASGLSNENLFHVSINNGNEEGYEVSALGVQTTDSVSQVTDGNDTVGMNQEGDYENEEQVFSREKNRTSNNNQVDNPMCSCFDEFEVEEWNRKVQSEAVELGFMFSKRVFHNGVHAVKEATLVVRNNADVLYNTLDKLDDDQTVRSASTRVTKVTYASNGSESTDTSSSSRANSCIEENEGIE